MQVMVCSEKSGNIYYLDKGLLKEIINSNVKDNYEYKVLVHSRLKVLDNMMNEWIAETKVEFKFSYIIHVEGQEDIHVSNISLFAIDASEAIQLLEQMVKETQQGNRYTLEITGFLKIS